MKHNFTVRHGALDGVEAFLSVARHRNFRKAAAEKGLLDVAYDVVESPVGELFVGVSDRGLCVIYFDWICRVSQRSYAAQVLGLAG